MICAPPAGRTSHRESHRCHRQSQSHSLIRGSIINADSSGNWSTAGSTFFGGQHGLHIPVNSWQKKQQPGAAASALRSECRCFAHKAGWPIPNSFFRLQHCPMLLRMLLQLLQTTLLLHAMPLSGSTLPAAASPSSREFPVFGSSPKACT